MTKLIAFVLLLLFATLLPAFADDTPGGVAADVGAVHKDNQAISKNASDLARDRAAKARDKARGNVSGQAADSLSIGADRAGKSEKEGEKSVDQRVLNHDVNNATSQ